MNAIHCLFVVFTEILIVNTSLFTCYHAVELEGVSCASQVVMQLVHPTFKTQDKSSKNS